jgi:hypothetical protein
MEEKEKEREKREQDLKENLHKRKQQAHNMQKRTRRGQPLMKYQIPNLLEKITKSMKK